MVKPDVIHPKGVLNGKKSMMEWRSRFISCFTNLFIYTMPSAIDCTVLSSQDEFQRSSFFDITSKSRQLWDDNNDLRDIVIGEDLPIGSH